MTEGPGSGSLEVTALILAGGSGQRLGAGGPKAMVEVGGRPMYEWSVEACRRATRIGAIILAIPAGLPEPVPGDPVKTVIGGESRSHSVANALEAVDTDLVVVHDAARPLAPDRVFDACIEELAARPELDCVVAGAVVSDTIKVVDERGIVSTTPDRARLRAIQTPQAFRTDKLRRAIESGDLAKATDDAALVEAKGGAVSVLHWREPNVKITTKADLELVNHLLQIRQ